MILDWQQESEEMIDQPPVPGTILQMANRLPPRARLQLAEQILAGLMQQLPGEPHKNALRPLLGLWQGFAIADEDIAAARREMWGDFADRDF